MKRFLLGVGFTIWAIGASASEKPVEPSPEKPVESVEAPSPEKTWDLISFRLEDIYVIQKGNANSGQISWNPTLHVSDILVLRGLFGGSLLKRPDLTLFTLLDYEAFFGVEKTVGIEVGGGGQTWVDNGGTYFTWGGSLYVSLPSVISRIFAGYGMVLTPTLSSVLRGGIAVSF